jgi:16S rRNA (adenine1518-N6/adenine1519-N6)-dimethyltransferase
MRLAERLPEGKVIAVERDRDMVRVLEAELGQLDNVEINTANALEYDYASIARWHGSTIAIAGNLPYQIATQILFRLLACRSAWSRAIVMVQREVADRLVAEPSSPAYGALGVIFGTWCTIDRVVRVRASGFAPAPKVDSAVVRLVPRVAPAAPIADEAHHRAVVHACFGQRRKTLRNALRARFAPEAVDAALGACGLDGGRRGETLSLVEFAGLANVLPAAAALAPDAE